MFASKFEEFVSSIAQRCRSNEDKGDRVGSLHNNDILTRFERCREGLHVPRAVKRGHVMKPLNQVEELAAHAVSVRLCLLRPNAA